MSVRGKLVKKTRGIDKEQLHKCKRDHELHFFLGGGQTRVLKLSVFYSKTLICQKIKFDFSVYDP